MTWEEIAVLAFSLAAVSLVMWLAGHESGYRMAYREIGRKVPDPPDDGMRAP